LHKENAAALQQRAATDADERIERAVDRALEATTKEIGKIEHQLDKEMPGIELWNIAAGRWSITTRL